MRKPSIRLEKAVVFAIVLNAAQILAVVGILAYELARYRKSPGGPIEPLILLVCLLIVIWGAALDIRDALSIRKIARQQQMIEEAYQKLEDLNRQLRAQRHDFMNHLQVVYSLTELGERDEALSYLEQVTQDLVRVGAKLRTDLPGVNALLAAKEAECSAEGISLSTEIRSPWRGMPIEDWAMCRVLGNLIDNAREAIRSAPPTKPVIRVRLSEDADGYRFAVSNNGPAIAPEHLPRLFEAEFTTKSDGHGLGLGIVKEIVTEAGGRVDVSSDASETAFTGFIPKPSDAPKD